MVYCKKTFAAYINLEWNNVLLSFEWYIRTITVRSKQRNKIVKYVLALVVALCYKRQPVVLEFTFQKPDNNVLHCT